MSTNYYWHWNPCAHCGMALPPIHIGLSSGGWRFLFHKVEKDESPLGEEISTAEQWRTLVQSGRGVILDEYRKPWDAEKFWEFVQSKNTHKSARRTPDGRIFHDPEGYDFARGEFG